MTHSCVWHDSFMCVTWLIHMCDMTHSCVWHYSFIYVTWLIHMCDMTHSYVLRVSCDMTYPYVYHDSIHVCDMTHLYIWHTHSCVPYDAFMCVAWLMHMHGSCHTHKRVTRYLWHDSFISLPRINMTHSYLYHESTGLIHMFTVNPDMTHSYSFTTNDLAHS